VKNTIDVKNMSETIKSISITGITYVNNSGQEIFISFESSHANYLKTIVDDSSIEVARASKRVGQRNIDIHPAYVELFTIPMTRFEFNSIDECHEFRHRIRKVGWSTMETTDE